MNIVRQAIKPGGKYHGLLETSFRLVVVPSAAEWRFIRSYYADACYADRAVRLITMQHPQQTSLEDLRRRLAAAEDEVIRIQYADDFCFSNGAYDSLAKVRDELKWAVMEAEAAARQKAAGIATASGEPGNE